MKKLICTSWNGRYLDHEKLCRTLLQYRNTFARKEGLSTVQKYLDILPKIHYQLIIDHSHPNDRTEQAQQQTDIIILQSPANLYNTNANTLPDIHVGSHVASHPKLKK